MPQELPASVLDHVRHLSRQLQGGGVGQLLRLSYSGERAYQPILSRLIREHGLDLSILHGQIDEIQDQTLARWPCMPAARAPGCKPPLRSCAVKVWWWKK